MITDSEIKQKGIEVLAHYLGEVEAERFIALVIRKPFGLHRVAERFME